MKTRTSILFVLMCLVFAACNNAEKEVGNDIECSYSSLLKMQQNDDYVKAVVTNPWDTTKILHEYILVDRNKPRPDNLPNGTVVEVPLQKSVVYSSVHLSLLNEWDRLDAVKGTYDVPYIFIPEVQERIKNGNINDLGNSMQPEIERLIETMPDAILLSPYENNSSYGKLEKTGIPIIECADYMEVSPLARAEWMKLYGILFGCKDIAYEMFDDIEMQYNSLKDSVAALKEERPTVFTDIKLGTQWMVPGGNSTVSIFLKDAGADYLFNDLPQSGSVMVSEESVLDKCQNADYWLIKYNSTYNGFKMGYDTLYDIDPVYGQFKPITTKKIFCCDTSVTGFYEDTPFHPERLLKNLVSIFHPAKDYNNEMLYYKKLE